MPKTGTTSLQKRYFVNWDAVNYFGSFGEPVSWRMLRQLNSMEEFEYRKVAASHRTYFDDLCDSGKPTLVSKEESLIGHQYPIITGFADRLNVARRFKDLFDEPEVVLVLRNQKTFLSSFFAQWQKHWYVTQHAFDKWLEAQFSSMEKGDGSVLNIPRYDLIFDMLCEVFGESKVHILFYEQFISHPDTFLDSFTDIVGAKLPAPHEVDSQRENTRPTSASLFLRKFRERSPGIAKLVPQRLKNVAKGLARRGSQRDFSPNEADLVRIEDFYRQGNRRLLEMANLELASHGYPV